LWMLRVTEVRQMNDVVISVDELQILLNMQDEISLMYPFYPHFQLFTAVPEEESFKLKVLIGEYDFDKQVEKLDEYGKEMPNYNDFLGCMLSSGVMTYRNLDEFKERLKAYDRMKKKVYYCPDTNIIYHMFISSSSIRDIVLVDTVKQEIESSLNFKYSPSLISELKKLVRYQSFLLDEWVNKRMKKSRKAYIALREYREIRDRAIEVEGVEKSTNDSEQNDRIIVRTVKRFEKERSSLPILLTADISMVDICELEGIEYFLFEFPHVIEADYCSAESMLELVYSLAVVFGLIRLNSVVIFGEFKGKSRMDELKLRFLDEKIFEKFERDLRICRKLMALGIER